MALPKKNTRTIDIEGKVYRYLIKSTSTDAHSYLEQDKKEITITVQEDCDKPGNLLQMRLSNYAACTPKNVRNIIEQSILAGWEPGIKGCPFIMDPNNIVFEK